MVLSVLFFRNHNPSIGIACMDLRTKLEEAVRKHYVKIPRPDLKLELIEIRGHSSIKVVATEIMVSVRHPKKKDRTDTFKSWAIASKDGWKLSESDHLAVGHGSTGQGAMCAGYAEMHDAHVLIIFLEDDQGNRKTASFNLDGMNPF
jgi:hypothetical protein